MKLLSLFSGIGGIDLAAQWAGIETVAFVEIDKYCQKVLAKHWPGVPIFDDVRTLTKESLRERGVDPESISVVAGGFPCQDISNAGKRAGIDGERSGLWREACRIICEIRPQFVVVENVAALLNRGLDRVLGDLAASGYDAEWSVLSACALGAPHARERLFLVAHASGIRFNAGWPEQSLQRARAHGEARSWWQPESAICGMADGLPRQVDRLRALGNAVVPQQVYPIFEAIASIDI